MTHNSVSYSNHDQGGHQKVEDRFGQLDEISGRRLVLLIERLLIVNQILKWWQSFFCVVKTVHIPRLAASTSSTEKQLFHCMYNLPSCWDVTPNSLQEKCQNLHLLSFQIQSRSKFTHLPRPCVNTCGSLQLIFLPSLFFNLHYDACCYHQFILQ